MFGIPDDLVRSASDFFAPAAAPSHSDKQHGHPHHRILAPVATPHVEPASDVLSVVGQFIGDVGHEAMDLVDVPGQIDRAQARSELADRFEVVGPKYRGPHHPNTVSSEEYDRIAHLYSDIRRGSGDLSIRR